MTMRHQGRTYKTPFNFLHLLTGKIGYGVCCMMGGMFLADQRWLHFAVATALAVPVGVFYDNAVKAQSRKEIRGTGSSGPR